MAKRVIGEEKRRRRRRRRRKRRGKEKEKRIKMSIDFVRGGIHRSLAFHIGHAKPIDQTNRSD